MTGQLSTSGLPAALRALRLHQWSKNVLVFLAPLGAHRLFEADLLVGAGLAFLAFGLVASALYVANDLHDLEADRRHPAKRLRPFASGVLAPRVGWVLVPALLAAGALVAVALPVPFRLSLLGYALATAAYSYMVKRLVAADVLLLAGLYTLRIYGGAFATGVPVSEWLATFSMFLFVSLAFLKRGSDLVEAKGPLPGRSYGPVDREQVFALGTACGAVAVLVLALYLSSPEVGRLYRSPRWLWGLCPLVLYWVSRLWLLARRGAVTEDPVVFTLRDPTTWFVGAAGGLLLLLGTRG